MIKGWLNISWLKRICIKDTKNSRLYQFFIILYVVIQVWSSFLSIQISLNFYSCHLQKYDTSNYLRFLLSQIFFFFYIMISESISCLLILKLRARQIMMLNVVEINIMLIIFWVSKIFVGSCILKIEFLSHDRKSSYIK